MRIRREAWLLTAIVAVFLALACTDLALPGLQYDEVLFGGPAIGHRLRTFVTYSLRIGGVEVPVMLMQYIGAVKAWLYAPIFALFGTGPIAVRLPVVLLGAITIVCVFQTARHLFDERVALLAAAFVAVDPSFICSVRCDWGPVAVMFVTKMSALALLTRYAATRRASLLFAASLLTGVGIFDKFNFVWHVASLCVAGVVCWPQALRALTPKTLAIAVTGVLLGCWPLLVYNLVTRGGTFAAVSAQPDFFAALVHKLYTLEGAMRGAQIPRMITRAPDPWPTTLLLQATLLSPLVAFVSRRHLAWRSWAFCALISLGIVAAIVLTPGAVGPHHSLMLWPFPHLMIAATFLAFVDTARGWASAPRAFGYVAALAFAIAFPVRALAVDFRWLTALRESGGRALWSDAIYGLADAVAADAEHRYYLMDWGFLTQILLLHPTATNFQDLSGPGSEAQIASRMRDPDARFVFHAPESAAFMVGRNAFTDALRASGTHEVILRRFEQHDGEVVMWISRAEAGAAPAIEKTDEAPIRAKRTTACNDAGLAVFEVVWSVQNASHTELRVNGPTGSLVTSGGPSGKAITGQWVSEGLELYLQDTSGATLATWKAVDVCR